VPQSPGPLVGSRQYEGPWCLAVLDRLSVLNSLKDCGASSPGALVGSRQYEGLWCLAVLDCLSVLDSSKDHSASESWTACRFLTVRRTVVPWSPEPLVGSRQYEGPWCLRVLDHLSPKIKVLLPSEISRTASTMTSHRRVPKCST